MAAVKGQKSSRNKQFWLDKGYNEEDAIKEARTRMPGTYEYYRFFKNFDEDTANRLYNEWKENKKVTLENMIRRYGEVEGQSRWDSYRSRQAYTNSFEYKNKEYGWTKDDFENYNNSLAITLPNMIKKYGELDGTSKYQAYCERQSFAGCKLEYFVEKYGIEEGTKKYKEIGFLKGNTFAAFLLRSNGDEIDAIKNYELYCKKLSESDTIFSSIIANELFDELYSLLIKLGYNEIYYTNNIGEWCLYDMVSKKVYFYDFFVKETGKLIEFNGDYWHANPNKYLADQIIKYPNNVQKTACEVWEQDKLKIQTLTRYPIIKDHLIIWESDYKENKSEIIQKCINFLTK